VQTSAWATGGTDAETERFLLAAEIVASEEVGTGVTLPRKVTLRMEGVTRTAIWKNVEKEYTRPDTGSPRMDDLYFTDRWQNEVAAYRVDRLIGLNRVPVTVIREIEGRPGSLQEWVEADFTERQRVEEGRAVADPVGFARDRDLLRLFDALIYNVDRTQENVLVRAADGRMWFIDQSRAFRLRRQLPAVDRDVPPVVAAAVVERLRALDRETLDEAIGGFLTSGQIKAILKRRDRVLDWVVPRD
jgi:hypothetical protein